MERINSVADFLTSMLGDVFTISGQFKIFFPVILSIFNTVNWKCYPFMMDKFPILEAPAKEFSHD